MVMTGQTQSKTQRMHGSGRGREKHRKQCRLIPQNPTKIALVVYFPTPFYLLQKLLILVRQCARVGINFTCFFIFNIKSQ